MAKRRRYWLPPPAFQLLFFPAFPGTEGMLRGVWQAPVMHNKQCWSRLPMGWVQARAVMLAWTFLALWILIHPGQQTAKQCFSFPWVWDGPYHGLINVLCSSMNSKITECRVIWPLFGSSLFLLFQQREGWVMLAVMLGQLGVGLRPMKQLRCPLTDFTSGI